MSEHHDGLPLPRRYWAIAAWMLGFGMSNLDGSIANVALPLIGRALHTNPATAVWVVNAFQIATAVFVLPMSSLADILGYKRVFQGGLLLFTLASLVCSLASSLEILIIGRVLQGAAAGSMVACLTSFMRFNYPASMLGRGVALNAMMLSITNAAGPAVASAILSVAPWPWLFAVNVPIGLIALAMSVPTLAPGQALGHRWDVPSALLNGAVFVLFIVGVQGLGSTGDLLTPGVEIGAAIAGSVLLVRRQLTRPAPMLGVDLLRIPLVSVSVITSLFCFVAQSMAVLALPFLLFSQTASPVSSGLLMTVWPVGAFLIAPFAGRLADRYPVGLLGAIGMGLFTAAMVGVVFAPAHPAAWDMAWRIALCGVGFGFFGPPNLRAIVSSAPRERSGAAGGLNTSFRLLGQASGTALVAVLFRSLGGGHATTPALHLIFVIAAVLAAIGGIVSSARIGLRQAVPASQPG
ncbi:MAG TPA: MFS transporter [Caulobacteraceae bacterium]|jgi:DHA2 family multidrug resistance protein-like MFS transporter